MEWYEAVDLVAPHIVHISTPRGSGTGFYMTSSATGICGVATAVTVQERQVERGGLWSGGAAVDEPTLGATVVAAVGSVTPLVRTIGADMFGM